MRKKTIKKEKQSNRDFTLYPLFYLAVCFSLGIFFANQVEIGLTLSLYTALIFAAAAIVFFKRRHGFLLILAAFFFVGCFYLRVFVSSEPKESLRTLYDTKQLNSGDPIEIEGVLTTPPL